MSRRNLGVVNVAPKLILPKAHDVVAGRNNRVTQLLRDHCSRQIQMAAEASVNRSDSNWETARSTKDGPWCWQAKAAFKRILDYTGDDEGATSRARSVYVALSEIASDQASETFVVNKALIGYRAGLSTRTVQRALRDLERASVVIIRRNTEGIKTASSYTLTGNDVSTSGHKVSTKRLTKPVSLADKVEERKELEEPIIEPGGEGKAFGEVEKNQLNASRTPSDRPPLLIALATVNGQDPNQIPASAWRGIARALREIRAVCPRISIEEINRRGRLYRQHMPEAMITPYALAKHWALCDRPPSPAQATGEPERIYPDFAKQ